MFGVDTIPDMFRTTANVTGDMTAAVVLGAREQHSVEAQRSPEHQSSQRSHHQPPELS